MNHSDLAGAALVNARLPARKNTTPANPPADDAENGPEAVQHGRDASAWAAGGQPSSE